MYMGTQNRWTWGVLLSWNEGPSRDWAWWRLDGWVAVRPRRREGEWGEGPSLAITAKFCLEFSHVCRRKRCGWGVMSLSYFTSCPSENTDFRKSRTPHKMTENANTFSDALAILKFVCGSDVVLWVWIPENSEPTLTCGLGQIFPSVHRPHWSAQVDRKKPPPPFFVEWFPKQEPGGRWPHLKEKPQIDQFWGLFFSGGVVVVRVPGLPIRDCAGTCNNRGPMRLKLSALDVIAKAIFERLYLVLVLRKFAPWVNCPYAPTTLTVQSTTISRFLCKFFPRTAPQFFFQHDSPSNLAESRYPRGGHFPPGSWLGNHPTKNSKPPPGGGGSFDQFLGLFGPPGSWFGNHPTKKPPPRGGVYWGGVFLSPRGGGFFWS